MDKDYNVFFGHILDSIEYLESYMKNISQEEFHYSKQLQDAVVKRIEIIGEAVNNLPERLKNIYCHIPWQDIVDMRNVLIHEYFGIDEEVVWKTIKEDLPSFKNEIIELVKRENIKL